MELQRDQSEIGRRFRESVKALSDTGFTIGECGHDNRVYMIPSSGFSKGLLISSDEPRCGYDNAICDDDDVWWKYVKRGHGSLSEVVHHFCLAAQREGDESDYKSK